MNAGEEAYYSSSTLAIRGTCKIVTIYNSVSLDSSLKKDYFLGTHDAVGYDCDGYISYCEKSTKNSEILLLTSSSTIKEKIADTNSEPVHFALFDKSFFKPKLESLYKKSGLPFSEELFPETNFVLLKKDEFEKIKNTDMLVHFPSPLETDTLVTISEYLPKAVYTFLYQEYGKYIHAPKGIVSESQYAQFKNTKNIISNNDLQIKDMSSRRGYIVAVPVTSPLSSVTNHWLYSQENGELVLSWQKVEYTFDDGSVKTVTNGDKNISVASLFSGHSTTVASSTMAATSSENVSATDTSAVVPVVAQEKSFFARLIASIMSWFK
jgi:hypothetical protein